MMDSDGGDTSADREEEVLQMAELELPGEWEHEHFERAAAIDSIIGAGAEGDEQELFDHVFKLGDVLLTWVKAREFADIGLSWPSSLYIPAEADWRQFWSFEPPAENRYFRAWSSGLPNRASAADGSLSAFRLIQPNERYLKQESGVGVRYSPKFSLGTVRLQPEVNCGGILRTYLEMYPTQVAGAVRVAATLVLAQWQETATGHDLIRWASVPVADSGWKDQSHGPLYEQFNRPFGSTAFSEQFLVEGGRAYLFGVVARISAWSTLTDTQGGPVPPLPSGSFKVWGQHDAVVRKIWITSAQIHIP